MGTSLYDSVILLLSIYPRKYKLVSTGDMDENFH